MPFARLASSVRFSTIRLANLRFMTARRTAAVVFIATLTAACWGQDPPAAPVPHEYAGDQADSGLELRPAGIALSESYRTVYAAASRAPKSGEYGAHRRAHARWQALSFTERRDRAGT